MAKASMPELKRFMDKRLSIKLNGNRLVSGRLRGFDQFMNLTLEESVEDISPVEKHELGVVVSATPVMIRNNLLHTA
jgi:small nuclear ribonucleoprotein G